MKSSKTTRALALLEDAGGGPWLVYIGAQWHPDCLNAQQRATALRAADADAEADAGAGGAPRRRLVYVSNDVDDEAADRVKTTILPHCEVVLRDEEAAELMRLLDVTAIPTVLLIDSATGAVQPLPFEEDGDCPVVEKEDGTATSAAAAGAAAVATGGGQVEDGGPVPVPAAPPEPGAAAAVAAGPAFAEALRRHEAGDWAGALAGFARALVTEPGHRADAAYNLAALLHMLGKARLAVHYAAMALEARPEDMTTHVLLGTVLAESEKDAVVGAYRRLLPSLKAWGGGAYHRAAHRLAVLTGEGPSARAAAPEYVREVFDAMAEDFEAKLVEHLGYKVPWQLFCAISQLRPLVQAESGEQRRPWRALDFGCGSGLCGRLFQPYCQGGGAMVGVDLSPKMVAKAQATGHYTEARVQDGHAALEAEEPGALDLLLVADAFIYVGALEPCFAAAARALRRPGGLFAFSIEALVGGGGHEEEEEDDDSDEGFRLVLSGRYAHTPAYVERLAAQHGLGLRTTEAVVVRQEAGEPIEGWIYVLEAEGIQDEQR